MALAAGTRLGPYEILGSLGAGGMGEVYRARDTSLRREVAVKVLPDAFARDPDRLARFEREARTLASLNHPNIAVIHGLERSSGAPALVLELVEGATLADRIAAGPLAVDEALPIARQIVDALEAAHEHGIVHRDLKPANVKVRPDGLVKVLDFGLAKLAQDSGPGPQAPELTVSPTITSPARMTGVGMLLGTTAYMSPEQARGKPVDRRADVWAFGCVLYEMLTGRRAFEDEDVSMTLSKVLQREPDFDLIPSGVPQHIHQTIRLCLCKSPKDRIPDIGSVRLALAGAFQPTGAATTAGPAAERYRWRRGAVALLAASVAGGLLVGLIGWRAWMAGVDPQPVIRFTDHLPAGSIFAGNGFPVVALSRDGRQVVYNTVAGLYLRHMGALEGRVVVGAESNAPFTATPIFSPDGQSIAYWQQGWLKRIAVSGGAAVVICEAAVPFGATWSTDNTILFAQPTGIMRVSANGGTPELVIAAKEGEHVYGPQLLPDGDSVLFSVTSSVGLERWDAAQIAVQSLSTGVRRVVLPGGSDARYIPTGHLVYALGTALFAVAFDASRLEVSGGPTSIATGVARAGSPAVNTAAANYAVSDDGALVYLRGAFSTAAAPIPLNTLVWVDRDGREEALNTPPRRYVYPRLSPDGLQVAIAAGDAEQDVWIWDLRRRTMTRFTFGPQNDTLPIWSPNARRLAWGSGGPLNLYWQASDGTGNVERLTESPRQQRPSAFTPDGRHLLLSEGPTGNLSQDLGMLSVEGDRRVTWLVQTTFSELNGAVSPDGRWLAYESDESGQFQVFVRPFPAVQEGRWQVSVDGGREPLWARNGRELFYVAPDGALMGVRLDGAVGGSSFAASAPTLQVAGKGYFTGVANQLGRTYDVSSDGSRFLRIKVLEAASTARDAPPELVVVLNWLGELRRLAPTN